MHQKTDQSDRLEKHSYFPAMEIKLPVYGISTGREFEDMSKLKTSMKK
jgi:hypothetical protein